MTKFCFHCGGKLEYSFSPPNFCSHCGQETGAKGEKKQKPSLKSVVTRASEDSEGYTNSEYIPSISKLEYEIEDFGSSTQQTIGSLGGKSVPKRRLNSVKSIDDL
tara:strand:- start:2427 stop:2741 length:315 start_codon:yes stop_codon:yes gene_type:complete